MLGSLSLLCAFEQGQVEFELTIIFYYPQGGLIRPYFKTIQCTWTIISCEKGIQKILRHTKDIYYKCSGPSGVTRAVRSDRRSPLFAIIVGTIGLSYLFNRKSKPHYNVCINLENESEEVLVRSGHKSYCRF